MKNLLKITLLLTLAIFAFSCNDDDDNGNVIDPDLNTIADFVADNSNYSSLLAALDRVGLVATLDGTTNFTVFAPNNDAFAAFLAANNFSSLEEVPEDLLRNVLLNHVVSGTVTSSDLSTGYVNSLATYSDGSNLSMFINTSSGVVINGTSTVTSADNVVDNGVIHAVNVVIGLPTIVDFAVADDTFSILVAALTRDDQPDFVATLSTADGTAPAPFTVFAPTNTAFGDLLVELGVEELGDIAGETLTATLNYHVVAEENIRAGALVDGNLGTLGGSVFVDGASIIDQNERRSVIIVQNVQGINGVIHAIDKVILPPL